MNDPVTDSEQLSDAGRQELMDLGSKFRARLPGLLDLSFDSQDFVVRKKCVKLRSSCNYLQAIFLSSSTVEDRELRPVQTPLHWAVFQRTLYRPGADEPTIRVIEL